MLRPPPAPQPNRRKAKRRRTRLRAGRVADMNTRFLADCLIFDRSESGVRIRLAGRMALPEIVKFYYEELNCLKVARIVWHRGNEYGLSFAREHEGAAPSARELAAIGGKYYALRR